MNKKVASMIALICIQVTLGMVFKFASNESTYKFSPASSLTISEFLKLLISLMLFTGNVTLKNIKSTFGSIWCGPTNVKVGALILAIGYLINNHLVFHLFTIADPGTINLVKSSSVMISAIILWMFANRSPLQIQWFAIAFQMLGLFVSQYEEKETGYPLSIYTLLGLSTLIAASCGCYNDYISKVGNTSLHLLNIYLYFFGFVLNLGYFWALRFTKEHQIGFFDGYSVCAVAILVCNSIIGLVITAVYKYADAIVKCIAQSISTSVLILCSWYFFGCKIRVMTVAGCLIVFFASYVYFFAKDLMTLDHAPKKVLKEKEPSPVKQKRKPVHSFMIVLVGTVILASILIGFSYYNFMSHNHVKVSANIF